MTLRRLPARRRIRRWICALAIVLSAFTAVSGEPRSDLAPANQQYDFAAGLLARGLHADAVAEFTRFLERFPNDPRTRDAFLWRAEARYQAGQSLDAARDFHHFLTGFPGAAPSPHEDFARVRYGGCLSELNRHENAIQTLTGMAERPLLAPDLRRLAAWSLGRSLLALNRSAEAATAFAAVVEGPLATEALFLRADALARAGESADAAAAFAQFLMLHPADPRAPDAQLRQAEELRAAGDRPAATRLFENLVRAAEADNADPAVRTRAARAGYGMAWLLLESGDRGAARSVVDRVRGYAVPPWDDGLRYLDGFITLEEGRPADAARLLATVATGPFAADAARRRAWALLAAGEYAAARDAADAFDASSGGTGGRLDYIRGRAYAGLGDWARAAEAFRADRDAVPPTPTAPDAAYEYALALDRAGRTADAARAYADFIRAQPRHPKIPDAFAAFGAAMAVEGNWLPAAKAFERVLELRRDPVADAEWRLAALGQAAACRQRLGELDAMRALYKQLLAEDAQRIQATGAAPHPAQASAWYWLAWLDARDERFVDAAAGYARVIGDYPDSPLVSSARYRRALCLYRAGREDEATDELLTLARGGAEEVDRQELLWLARRLLDDGRFDDADAAYGALLARDPSASERVLAHYWRGEIRRRAARWREALAEFDAALAATTSGDGALSVEIRLGRAAALRSLGDLAAARVVLTGLEAELPPDAPSGFRWHYEMAALDAAEGRGAAAMSGYMRVGLLSPDETLAGSALWEAARLAEQSGDPRARACYEDLAGVIPDGFGQRFPENPLVARAKEKLDASP